MIPADFFLRIPPAAALLVLSSIINPAASHVLPRQTRTLEHRTLNVEPWPLATPAPTALPGLHGGGRRGRGPNPLLLAARQFNTVCGYIGGDPDLPATCSAGSHCAVDVQHSAVGCCPDGAPCTAGVYTGCVDADSGPQTELNPYVYTCRGADVCFQNKFDGGYFQFGCGSTTGMGATVAPSASGREPLDLTMLSVAMTASRTALSEPTTLGTRTSTSEEEGTSSATETKESSTGTATEETNTSEPSATDVEEGAAPDTSSKDKPNNIGPIVGGTIGGLAFLMAMAILGLYFWRRKKGNARQGPGLDSDTKYISPTSDPRHPFQPLPPVQEVDESQHAQEPTRPRRSADISSESYHHTDDVAEPVSPYYSSGSSREGFYPAVGGSGPQEPDRMPLTSDLGRAPGANDYHGGDFARPSDDYHDEDIRPPPDGGYGAYPGPRRGSSGALWQQTRNTTWL